MRKTRRLCLDEAGLDEAGWRDYHSVVGQDAGNAPSSLLQRLLGFPTHYRCCERSQPVPKGREPTRVYLSKA